MADMMAAAIKKIRSNKELEQHTITQHNTTTQEQEYEQDDLEPSTEQVTKQSVYVCNMI